jgi:hypothetical protein
MEMDTSGTFGFWKSTPKVGGSLMSDGMTRRDAAKLFGLSLATTAGGQPDPGPNTVPDFAGRAVIVYTSNRPVTVPIILTDCRFERQGGRLFLVGISQPCRRSLVEWSDGSVRCVAWDAVEEYVVFDSLAAFHTRQESTPREIPQRAQGSLGGAEL